MMGFLLATLFFFPFETFAQAGQAARRNVVFILSDDHRYDFMGFHERAPAFLGTPSMDKMAAGGVHIRNAFVSTALCSPSRASILTGMYAHKHGVVDNNTLVPSGTIYFPEYLQKAGYKTAFIGKWHMGHDSDEPRPGFDKWISFRGQGDYYNPTLNIDGQRSQIEGYTTDLLTNYAIDWIKQNRDVPFFLYLSHKAVHAMFEPAERHRGRYEHETLIYPETMANTEANYRQRPSWVREQRYSWHGVDYMYHGQMDFDTFYRRYTETLLALDESVGRVLEFLEQNGLSESTLVIHMGDNGFSFGEHGLIDKRHMYEESMRVPMLAYAPGMINPGSHISEMIQNIDIAPTILELAGIQIPDEMDGTSFLPVLKGETNPWRNEVFYEYYWERNFPQTPTVFGLRGDRYKYILYHGIWDIDEFYDLQNDPFEKNNLIFSVEHQETINNMRNRLFDILEQTDGMKIPLRRPEGGQLNQRKLH